VSKSSSRSFCPSLYSPQSPGNAIPPLLPSLPSFLLLGSSQVVDEVISVFNCHSRTLSQNGVNLEGGREGGREGSEYVVPQRFFLSSF